MSNLLAVLILIVVALAGAKFSFSTSQVPAGPRLMVRTGTHFLVLGFLLGPSALGLLTPEATTSLFPFLALGLGWVGLHFGLQLHWGTLRRLPASHFVIAFGQALLTFAIFAGGAYWIATALGLSDDVLPLLVLAAACTASVTTPAGIAMISATFRVRGKVRDLLVLVASLDALIGILALQVTYSLYRPEVVMQGLAGVGSLRWVAAALGLGMVCGFLFVWLSLARPSAEELVLYLLGIAAFSAGAALQWGLSPLFVAVTMGAVVANVGASGRRALPLLERWEKTVYVTFLLLAGALITVPTWIVLPAALGYALLRFVAKTAATATVLTVLPVGRGMPKSLGLGLIPQGGISIAMAVSGLLMYSGLQIQGFDAEAALFAVIIIGVFLSELVGPFFAMGVLRRAGEIPEEEEVRPGAQPDPGEPEQTAPEAEAVPSGGDDDPAIR